MPQNIHLRAPSQERISQLAGQVPDKTDSDKKSEVIKKKEAVKFSGNDTKIVEDKKLETESSKGSKISGEKSQAVKISGNDTKIVKDKKLETESSKGSTISGEKSQTLEKTKDLVKEKEGKLPEAPKNRHGANTVTTLVEKHMAQLAENNDANVTVYKHDPLPKKIDVKQSPILEKPSGTIPKINRDNFNVEVKPKRDSPVQNDKKTCHSPTSDSKIANYKCARSILADYEVNHEFPIYVNLTREGVSNFFAAVIDDEAVAYISNKLSNEIGSRIDVTKPGEFVLIWDESEKMFERCFVLGVENENIEAIDIDFLKPKNVIKSKVYRYPKEAFEFPAIGILCVAVGNISVRQEKYINEVFEQKSDGIYIRLTDRNESCKGHLKNFIGTMLEDRKKPLFDYSILPWTAMDPRIPKLLGQIEIIKFSDLPTSTLKVGDKLLFIDFGPSSNRMIVTNEKDVIHEENILKHLENLENGGKIINEIKEGQVVACKWSEDKLFYRALVNKVNSLKKRVRVRFLDHGNLSEEPFEHLYELPDGATKFPSLAHLIQLDGIEEFSMKDVQTANRYVQHWKCRIPNCCTI